MNPAERGFTLIELLIAIALVALTTLMLVEGVRMAATRIGGQQAGLDRASTIVAVEDFLRNEVADARPFPSRTGIVSFEGRPDGVAFVADAPESLTRAGLLNLTLAIVPAANAAAELKLTWQAYRQVPVGENTASERVLLDRVADARFAYFGSARPNDAPHWQDTWSGMSQLPLLMRLQMRLVGGESPPDFVVALRLAPGSDNSRNMRQRF